MKFDEFWNTSIDKWMTSFVDSFDWQKTMKLDSSDKYDYYLCIGEDHPERGRLYRTQKVSKCKECGHKL